MCQVSRFHVLILVVTHIYIYTYFVCHRISVHTIYIHYYYTLVFVKHIKSFSKGIFQLYKYIYICSVVTSRLVKPVHPIIYVICIF